MIPQEIYRRKKPRKLKRSQGDRKGEEIDWVFPYYRKLK